MRSIALTFLLCCCTPALGITIIAEGIASSEGSTPQIARTKAIRNALWSAGLQAGASVDGSNQQGRDQSRITPEEPLSYRIVREFIRAQEYHVEISADFQGSDAATASTHSQRRYRKTIASAYFQITNPQHVSDIDNPWDGLPRELMQRLEQSTALLPTTVSRGGLFTTPQAAQRFEADPDLVKRLAQSSNSQFVAVGRLLDASITAHSTRPFSRWQSDSGSTGHSSQFNQGWQNENNGGNQSTAFQIPGLPWNFGLQNQASSRRLEIEILLYDGYSGILLKRLRAQGTADGLVTVGRDKSFGSQNFYSTDFGKTVNQVLDTLVHQLEETAACLPLNARVVKVEGKTAYIDAGTQQNLRPGDSLTLFAPDRNTPVFSGDNNIPLGLPEQPLGTIVIKTVQPKFAIGEIHESAGKRVQVGDTARYDEPQSRQQKAQAAE